MKTEIRDARVTFHHRQLIKPLLLSSGPIHDTTEARAAVTVRVNGREATGYGSMYLSDLWAWPDPQISHERRVDAMRALCERIATQMDDLCGGEPEHPMELGLRLHHTTHDLPLPDNPSVLARAVCASPFDAALHDAVGQALGVSAFRFYDEPTPLPSADPYFADGNACAAITRALRPPKTSLAAWIVIGPADELEKDLAPWIRERGYNCFKLKLMGKDNAVDAARTIEVYRAAQAFGASAPRIAADTNCANPDAASVGDYLERLRVADAETYAALEYLEQPTGRDIKQFPNDWHPVTKLKPVLLDEGLTGPELFEESAAQGWSGFALKTCKGQSFSLLCVAWARENGLLLALQDLTNPGYAAIHAALFAAHVATLNDVELNSPQFTPAANEEWLPRLRALLDPYDGQHRLPETIPAGLGSNL